MSIRGGCKHCVWLSCGKTCMSTKAVKLTEKGKQKSLYGETVRELKRFWNHKTHRMTTTFEYDGCFAYTLKKMKVKGVSGFQRKSGRMQKC